MPTPLGDLDTHVEVDFYGADGNESVSNSHGLRLRHTYFSVGCLLAGHTWTYFMNPAALPETLDFGGPAGQIFAGVEYVYADRETEDGQTEHLNRLQASAKYAF